MKQLLLYFLFFVGAALVFIQCAKTFPTTDKIFKPKPNHAKSIEKAAYTSNNGFDLINNTASAFKFEKAMIMPFFNSASLPYQMMVRINGHRTFNNPYMLFRTHNFAANSRDKWLADKQ